MSHAGPAVGLTPLRYWGSPVELSGDCNLSRFTRHRFLAMLLEAVVGHDGPFASPHQWPVTSAARESGTKTKRPRLDAARVQVGQPDGADCCGVGRRWDGRVHARPPGAERRAHLPGGLSELRTLEPLRARRVRCSD